MSENKDTDTEEAEPQGAGEPQRTSADGMPLQSTVERTTAHMAAHHSARRRTREATDEKIARAALEVALSNGPDAVTVEEVSRRSGVAKTTIYRRYRNSTELLRAIRGFEPDLLRQAEPLEPSRKNLELMIAQVVRFFDRSVGVRGVGVMLSSDSALFHTFIARLLAPVRERADDFFARGARMGVFRNGIDVDFILDVIVGAMVVRAAMTGMPGLGPSGSGHPDPGQSGNGSRAHRADGLGDDWASRMASFLWPHIAATA